MSAMPALEKILPLLPSEETPWLRALLARDYGETLAIFNPQAFVLQAPSKATPWPEQTPDKPWPKICLYVRASQPLSGEELAWLEKFKRFFATLTLYPILYPGENLSLWARWQLLLYLRKKIFHHLAMSCQIKPVTVLTEAQSLLTTAVAQRAWQQQQRRALIFYCQHYRKTTENQQTAINQLQAIEQASQLAFDQLSSRLIQLQKNQSPKETLLTWQQDLTYQALAQALASIAITLDSASLLTLAEQHLQWQKQPRFRLERHKKSRLSTNHPWGILQSILKQGERLFQALLFSTLIGIIAWAFGIDHGILLTFILLSALILGWRFQLKKTTAYTLIGREVFFKALAQSWQSSTAFQKIQTLVLWEQSCPPISTTRNAKP